MSDKKIIENGIGEESDREPFHYPLELSDGYATRIAYQLRVRTLEEALEFSGVSLGQWYFLRALWSENGLTQRELSERVCKKEPTTALALKGMEKSQLIYRVRDSGDLRKVRVYLTGAGHGLRNVLLPRVKLANDRAIAGISPQDLQKFRTVMKKITKNLRVAEDLEPVGEDSRPFNHGPCWKMLSTNGSAGSGRHKELPKATPRQIGLTQREKMRNSQLCANCFISSNGRPRCPPHGA